MTTRESIAWGLLVAVLVSFVLYTILDQKLNWIAFGSTYRNDQAQVVNVLKEQQARIEALEKK